MGMQQTNKETKRREIMQLTFTHRTGPTHRTEQVHDIAVGGTQILFPSRRHYCWNGFSYQIGICLLALTWTTAQNKLQAEKSEIFFGPAVLVRSKNTADKLSHLQTVLENRLHHGSCQDGTSGHFQVLPAVDCLIGIWSCCRRSDPWQQLAVVVSVHHSTVWTRLWVCKTQRCSCKISQLWFSCTPSGLAAKAMLRY